MDDKLLIMQHLYGEAADDAERRRLLEDEALRSEYEALREVKELLDRRPPARPDAEVLDRIAAAAALPPGRVAPRREADRRARPGRMARRFGFIGAASAVLAVVLVVIVGRDQVLPPGLDTALNAERQEAPAGEMREQDDVEEPAPLPAAAPADNEALAARRADADRSGARPLAPDADPRRPAPAETEAAFADALGQVQRDEVVVEEDAPPAWDEGEEMIRLHQNIEMLKARSRDLAWDESAVMSLDVLPEQHRTTPPGLDAAGEKRGGH